MSVRSQTSRSVFPMKVSLDDGIDILDRNAVEVSPVKQIFGTVRAILALVRDKVVDDEGSVQLCEHLFDVCEALKTAIQGKDVDDLSEPERIALGDLERLMRETECTLEGMADVPHTEYNEKVEIHKLQIREVLKILNVPVPPLDQNLGVSGPSSPHLAPVDPHEDAIISVPESACRRLIIRAFAPHELPSLAEAIFSSKDEANIIRGLRRDDAQTFIDVLDEALDITDLSPSIRKKCLKSLYRMCGRHALLPAALKIPVCYDRTSVASYKGGYGDVWKGEYRGRDVAVKVIRMYLNSDLQRIVSKFCKEVVTWKTLQHPNVLSLIGVTMSENRFEMISDWMVNGNINDFVKAHPRADRLGLLVGVARGLIYIHGQGMVHGDLKGANILVDQAGHVRLADFGLLTVISDSVGLPSSSSYTQGGTVRWMSPERIAPERFGFKNGHPTQSSDCYALGMVIYETISERLPFHRYVDFMVSLKVVEGEHPPRGVRFTERLWKMLELCWTSQPKGRPSIEDVLQCLEMASTLSEVPSPEVGGEMEKDDDSWDSASSFSCLSNGTNGTVMTEGVTAMPPSLNHLTNHMPSLVLTVPGPSYDIPDLVLAPQIILNDRSAHQDPHTVPNTPREARGTILTTRAPDLLHQPLSTHGTHQPLKDNPAEQHLLNKSKPKTLRSLINLKWGLDMFGNGDKDHQQLPPAEESITSPDSTPLHQRSSSTDSQTTETPTSESDLKKLKEEAKRVAKEAEKKKRAWAEKMQREQARAVMQKRNALMQATASNLEWKYTINPNPVGRLGEDKPSTRISTETKRRTHGSHQDRDGGATALNAASGMYGEAPFSGWRGDERLSKARRRDWDNDHSMSSSDLGRMSVISFATGQRPWADATMVTGECV